MINMKLKRNFNRRSPGDWYRLCLDFIHLELKAVDRLEDGADEEDRMELYQRRVIDIIDRVPEEDRPVAALIGSLAAQDSDELWLGIPAAWVCWLCIIRRSKKLALCLMKKKNTKKSKRCIAYGFCGDGIVRDTPHQYVEDKLKELGISTSWMKDIKRVEDE